MAPDKFISLYSQCRLRLSLMAFRLYLRFSMHERIEEYFMLHSFKIRCAK